MIDKEEKIKMAYIAGLIDGDGTIAFRKTFSRGSIVYTPLIQIHNSIKDMCELLHSTFGGTLAKDKPKKEHHKVVHKWMLQGYVGCLKVLEKITEFLITKKEPALKLLDFLKNNVPAKGKFFSYLIEPKDAENVYLCMKTYTRNRKNDISILNKPALKCTEDEVFWAYLAGIIETDGSFSILREKRKPTAENRQLNDLIKYRPCIQLTMITGDNLNHILSNTCLGKVYTINSICTLKGIAYKLNVKTKDHVIKFINRILPYLKFKKKQAEILLNFCSKYTPTINCREKVPVEEKEFRENCYSEIIRLNKNMPS